MHSSELLERFAASVGPPGAAEVLAAVRAYLAWRAEHTGITDMDFGLRAADDVELRNYLLHLRTAGLSRLALRRVVAALGQFYAWAAREGYSDGDPFEEYDFDRPFLSRSEIRRRQPVPGLTREESELQRLRALHRLAEHLNRTPDVANLLDITLATVLEVMGLQTAWAFLHRDAPVSAHLNRGGRLPLHDFELAAASGLPPGLEQADRYYLRAPDDCHCQSLLRQGRLTRAVNVVECTRLLNASEGELAGLLFHATIPLTIQGQPVGLLNFATDEWQLLSAADLQLLSAVGAQLSIALERAQLYEQAQAQRLRLEEELTMARAVQASLLPAPLPAIPGYSLAAEWRAAREMAGDFYDVLPLPAGRWGLLIADVSDKGAPAALYMAMMHSLVHAAAERAAGPAALLAEVNHALCQRDFSNMFVTVFYAVLDPASSMLIYANAGHNPPLVRRPDGHIDALPRSGLALGVLPEPHLAERSLPLAPGTALLAYTDGVTEARSPAGEEYGLPRLRQTLAQAPPEAAPLLEHVQADLAAFIGSAVQADDITLLAVAVGS